MNGPIAPLIQGHHHLLRLPHLSPHLRAILLGAAVGALVMFVATDVLLYENLTAPVQVSTVNWYTQGQLFATSHGFAVHTSQAFNLTLKCAGFCYRFNGAALGSPFHLVSTQIFYYPSEYVNLTARAPSAGYSGPLSVILTVG